MSTKRLTPYNVQQYIGYDIVFKHDNNEIIKKIISVSNGRKVIKIEYPPLQNSLQIASRDVRVIV